MTMMGVALTVDSDSSLHGIDERISDQLRTSTYLLNRYVVSITSSHQSCVFSDETRSHPTCMCLL